MRRLSDRSGAISVMTAGMLIVLAGAAALSIDLGSVYVRSRQLQGAADLAAMAAVENIANAKRTAQSSLDASPIAPRVSDSTLTLGRYTADGKTVIAERFHEGMANPNAVRLTVRATTPLYFASLLVGRGSTDVERSATAARAQLASFQIGSRLARLQGGAPNALLSALTGSQISLTVMDYQSLADADIDLFDYLGALRTRAHLQGATFDKLTSVELETPLALAAIGDVLTPADRVHALEPLARLAEAPGLQQHVDMAALFALGPYGAQDTASPGQGRRIAVSALDLATAVLETANGERQLKLAFAAAAPGLAKVTGWLAIGERPNNSPWLAITDSGDTIIRTAQMRLYLETEIAVAGLAGVASVRVPILLEAASAQAKLTAIQCGPSQQDAGATISVAPSIGQVTLGDIDTNKLDNFKKPLSPKPAKLVDTLLLTVEGAANTKLGGETWTSLSFNASDIAARKIKTVATQDLARASVATLLGNTTLTGKAIGLGVNVAPVLAAVKPVLTQAAPPIDALVNDLTDFLGLHLGEADVRVNGVRCNGAALVQ